MRLTSLIAPDDSAIGDIADGIAWDGSGPVDQLVHTLCGRLAQWRLAARLGPTPLAQVVADRSGNCIDLAAVLCSALIRLGASPSLVLLGSWAGAFPALVHAWTLTYSRPSASWFIVDPRNMTARQCQPADIEAELTITAIFDHERIIVSAAERAAFWQQPTMGS